MLPLDKTLRNRLEKSIKDARDIAEDAARAALEQLGVKEAKAFEYLTSQERHLRIRLRAHGRQLGDERDTKTKGQEIERLIEEVAYEHWHRMLFARFLAENNLLMYPDPDDPIAISIEECEDLAAEEGAQNGWELACKYAALMLPQIFRPDSPSFQLILPPEYEQKLEQILAGLDSDVFTASDSLGWVYQFWQSKRKDEVNASEDKIGARELPAVTQLFTEPYMVSFLLDNSLGVWWAGKRLTEEDLKLTESEAELREKLSISGVPLEYLRFVKEDGVWTPAAGKFSDWPEHLSELKTLDPCCGSGHFLVAAFLMLVPMRMELEKLSAKESIEKVLEENIHGLEIDQRCVELAAFALALTAWRYPDAGGYRVLPELNLACSGLSITGKEAEWTSLAADNPDLKIALGELYNQFKDASILGSLINPESSLKKETLFELKWDKVDALLKKALGENQDDDRAEMGVVAKGLTKAAQLLSNKYYWVTTNVPYRSSNDLSENIRSFTKEYYKKGETDLATVFLLRVFEYLLRGGNCSIVIPQNLLVQPTYKLLRKELLENHKIRMLTRLGPGAFQEISGEVVNALLFSADNNQTVTKFQTLDCGRDTKYEEKIDAVKESALNCKLVKEQIENPDHVIFLGGDREGVGFLGKYASSIQGIKTGEDARYKRKFWELFKTKNKWIAMQSTAKNSCDYSGLEHYLFWGVNGEHLARKQGMAAWGRQGVAVSQMSALPSCIYLGGAFDSNMTAIVPNDINDLRALYSFANCGELSKRVRQFDQSIKPTNSSFEKIDFDIIHWNKVSFKKYPIGLPKPYSDDSTQWIFHGNPFLSDSCLQVSMARLLGYRWPAELDKDMELSEEARSLVKSCDGLLSLADEDGIVCVPAVRGEMKAEERLERILAKVYGEDWSSETKNDLLSSAGHGGKSLESWLRNKFFIQHCKLFHHRPFIWHVWDGLNDGFAAFLNYHKLDHKTLETLIYTYLGDWINQQNHDLKNQVDGAQEKLSAALNLKKNLELILEGEKPYDIFVRWKPIEKQPIGWNPDLNDGVRLNIRPFMSVPDVGKKGTGVLRDKPNIKWGKDRGKDVESAPWYPLFKGDRINEHHLSLEEKISVRKQV